jgi:tripartite-type tricarboxylate transporter receptor subunit TctC
VKDGKLVALGVSSARRLPAIPDIPTIAESGLPDYTWDGWYGLLAPAKTPRAVIAKLNDEITRVVHLPELTQRWAVIGAQAAPCAPEQFDKVIAKHVALVTKLARAAKIKVE